jgi:hypothetical protein
MVTDLAIPTPYVAVRGIVLRAEPQVEGQWAEVCNAHAIDFCEGQVGRGSNTATQY